MPRGEGGSSPAVEEHVAAAAWRALGPDRPAPSAVEVVRAGNPGGRCVYRLLHADGNSVIAKRCRVAAHRIERLFYRDVLPYLPVSTARFYGEIEADDGYAWIFLEDGGRRRFSPRDAEHRGLAARWLGAMHVAAPALPVISLLPDRGLRHYHRHLDAGRRLIVDNLDNPGLSAGEVALLRSVVALCSAVELRWPELEEICAAAPSTLVHGDFRPRNVFVADAPGGRQRLLPIDWELAGWAVPAADLAPRHGQPQVDLEEYCRIMQERWSDFDLPLARRLMWVGLIFRRLAAIEWSALSLHYPQPEVLAEPLSRIRIYHEELGRALADGGPRD